ncbi:MAG TPA: hypothetical protein VNC79_00510 [Mycobacteriales bacterium]|nr:hypothetical protein [Mycobacteriales bacterium]
MRQRIADLEIVGATLAAALDAGCDDLATCAATPACPLPFDGTHPVARPA